MRLLAPMTHAGLQWAAPQSCLLRRWPQARPWTALPRMSGSRGRTGLGGVIAKVAAGSSGGTGWPVDGGCARVRRGALAGTRWSRRRRSPTTERRRSMRSVAPPSPSTDASTPGNRMRAHMISRRSRGAVAPRMSVSPWLTMSAARVSSARPNRAAWPVNRSALSSDSSIRPRLAARYGRDDDQVSQPLEQVLSEPSRVLPVSTTFSMTPKRVAPSSAARASTVSSRSVSGV